jgi:hypothetical protein
MLKNRNQPQYIRSAKLLLVAGLALLFTFIFSFPSIGIGLTSVYAQQARPLGDGPSILSVSAGFNGTYRVGNWIPIQVKVSNNGGEFDGIISVSLATLYTGSTSTSISLYQAAISLPAISQKQITMYVPIEAASGAQGAPSSLTIHLQDSSNHEVAKKSVTINSVASNELYIGLISDHSLDVRQLTSALSGQNAHTRIEPLSASTLPTSAGGGLASVLNNFDLLVLDNTVTSTLSNDQRTALQAWVNQGGTLVEVGGPEWHSTLGSLPPALLPVTITGTDTVAAGQHLLPQEGANTGNNGTDDTLATAVPISVATAKPGSLVLLSFNNTPLIVQDSIGQGQVYYLAYDPFLDPLVNWTNTSNLWSNLLMRTLGDQVLTINNGNSGYGSSSSKYNLYGSMNSFLETLIPNAFPSIWLILTLLISYVLILGPLRFFLIRWSKKKAWSWRIVLATIVLFSLLSYGLALQVKGTSVVSSNVSVMQLSPDGTGSQAHVTDYAGVYVPSNGDFHVHIPGVNLVEVTDQSSIYGPNFIGGVQSGSGQSSAERTAITTQADNTDVDLQGMDNWTLRTLASKYDTHIRGGISSNLTFSQNVITGTVTNTLPYTLNDAYLLAGNDYIALGKLGSGQTQTVQLTVSNQTSTQSNNGGSTTLADQISSSKGFNANQYNPLSVFGSGQSPTDENYRHASMLEALSGGNCNTGPCFKNFSNSQFIQPHLLDGPERGYAQDPLLVTGAPATLIGWIDNAANTSNITINNGTPPGAQESLIQAPINLHFTGKIDVPATLSAGQIVNAQPGPNSSNLPQATGPGVYNLTTGSITFELQLPIAGNLQAPTLTFSDASVASKMSYINNGPTQGSTNDVNTMNVNLYNWQTNTWDSKTFTANTFSVDNAQNYIGPNGRVLIQLANGQNSQNATIFTMPGVELTATITN